MYTQNFYHALKARASYKKKPKGTFLRAPLVDMVVKALLVTVEAEYVPLEVGSATPPETPEATTPEATIPEAIAPEGITPEGIVPFPIVPFPFTPFGAPPLELTATPPSAVRSEAGDDVYVAEGFTPIVTHINNPSEILSPKST